VGWRGGERAQHYSDPVRPDVRPLALGLGADEKPRLDASELSRFMGKSVDLIPFRF
jgi:hypothetical protein